MYEEATRTPPVQYSGRKRLRSHSTGLTGSMPYTSWKLYWLVSKPNFLEKSLSTSGLDSKGSHFFTMPRSRVRCSESQEIFRYHTTICVLGILENDRVGATHSKLQALQLTDDGEPEGKQTQRLWARAGQVEHAGQSVSIAAPH